MKIELPVFARRGELLGCMAALVAPIVAFVAFLFFNLPAWGGIGIYVVTLWLGYLFRYGKPRL